jgi:hypothetical protein
MGRSMEPGSRQGQPEAGGGGDGDWLLNHYRVSIGSSKASISRVSVGSDANTLKVDGGEDPSVSHFK